MKRTTAIPKSFGRRIEVKSVIYLPPERTACPICKQDGFSLEGLCRHGNLSHGVLFVPDEALRLDPVSRSRAYSYDSRYFFIPNVRQETDGQIWMYTGHSAIKFDTHPPEAIYDELEKLLREDFPDVDIGATPGCHIFNYVPRNKIEVTKAALRRIMTNAGWVETNYDMADIRDNSVILDLDCVQHSGQDW